MWRKIERPFVVVIALTALSYVLSIVAIQYKGLAIEAISRKLSLSHSFLLLLSAFVGLKIVSALVNTLRDNLTRFYVIREFERAWKRHMPKRVHKQAQKNADTYFFSVYENIPKLYELRLESALLLSSAVVIFVIFLFKVVQDRFWWGLAYFPVLALLSALVSKAFAGRYRDGVAHVAQKRSALLQWLRSCFQSQREVYFNWRFYSAERSAYPQWYQDAGAQVGQGLREHAKTALYRDLLGSLGVDWPYIFCISGTLVAAAVGGLSVAQAIVWMALTDYLINGSNSLRSYFGQRVRIQALEALVEKDLAWLQNQESALVHEPAIEATPTTFRFELLDGSSVEIGVGPGLYHVRGSNGSGKSTLMDTLLGHNQEYKHWSPEQIAALRRAFGRQIRVIERDPVVFADLATLQQQVFGPLDVAKAQKLGQRLQTTLNGLLPPKLASAWRERFDRLEQRWQDRANQSLSTGEKIAMSFARMLSQWEEGVRLVVVDECDSALDRETRQFFLATLDHLAQRLALYYISHVEAPALRAKNSYATSVFLLGANAHEAKAIPMYLSASSHGQGRCECVGSVGAALAETFTVAKRALIHSYPHFEFLNRMDYVLDCHANGYEAGETRSAGLAITIALFQIAAMVHGQKVLSHTLQVAATGNILLDGSVEGVRQLEAKTLAAEQCARLDKVITPCDLTHLRELPALLLARA